MGLVFFLYPFFRATWDMFPIYKIVFTASNLSKFCSLLEENEFFSNATRSTVSLNEVPSEGQLV